MTPEQHKTRIRRRARGVSWGLGPLLGIAYIAWFFWNLVVCPSGAASGWELTVCRNSHWLPDAIGALVVANLVWMVFAVVAYSEEVSGVKRAASDSRFKHYATSARDGYRTLDDEQRSVVFRSLEAAVWCLVFTVAVLVFYQFEVSPPLAVAVIALVARVLYGLLSGLHDRLTGTGTPPGRPSQGKGGPSKAEDSRGEDTKPDNRVLGLSAALFEEFELLYKEPPKHLFGTGEAGSCDRGFCANIALNHLEKQTAALCLSGGGIRSASFCLGVVQALSRKGLLPKFKYLSTVSGGGYTGSLLTAWAYRSARGLDDVVAGLRNPAAPQQPNPVGWLRQFCSYLAPRRGLLSTDTWTVLVTYIRNLLLNSLILVPFLMVIVSSPRLAAAALDAFAAEAPALTKRSFVQFTIVLAVLSLLAIVIRLRIFSGKGAETEAYASKLWSRVISGLAWTFAIALAAGLLVEALGPAVDRTSYIGDVVAWMGLQGWVPRAAYWALAIGSASVLIGLWFAGTFKARAGRTTFDDRAVILAGHVAAGTVIGVGITAWEHLFQFADKPAYADIAQAFVLGPPALLFVLACGEAVFLGITSKLNDDYHREWWSRLFGWLSRWALIWMALGTIAFAGPWVAERVAAEAAYAILYPAGILAAGATLARIAFTQGIAGKLTDEKVQSQFARMRQGLFVVAAYVFVVMLLCFMTWFAHRLALGTPFGPWSTPELLQRRTLPYSFDRIGIVMSLLVLVFMAASLVVNVNKFSLHSMYRDRLIRAFLGASRSAYPPTSVAGIAELNTLHREGRQFEPRNPNLYTDFDRDDNPILWWMSPGRASRQLPFLVINGALNLVRSKDLAWQERKAASFTFTPLHVGSDLTNYAPAKEFCGEVGGVTLGTALAISGAAVSPNAGYHSTPILTFLLTLFNARLGWWLGNPRHLDKRGKIGPTVALVPFINELAGKTDAESDWVYISDGGHFDNLGVYEMVRRGCSYIVAVDASADPRFEYDSLGIAIRKIRIDFGIPLDLMGSLRIGQRTQGEAGAFCSLFRIGYDERIGSGAGLLLYIKAAHYPRAPNSPVDVRQYGSGMSSFPHEPTTNQFFGESQFESYRALGDWEVEEITSFATSVGSLEELITLAQAHANFYQSEKPGAPGGAGGASSQPGTAALE
jgi:patatin-like phospholipase